ncbi:hypothetical protein [Psychrobacillus sp. FSL K6-1464]|uniref:hypothetical protein n=1 Tax=Psychrobacillus sp. FSL K6-1464 TaxID=2921545 RepID=UPI0030F9F221
MSYPVDRKVIDFNGQTFIVDLWVVDGKYNAHAQEIYVKKYHSSHGEGFPSASIAEFTVINELMKKQK